MTFLELVNRLKQETGVSGDDLTTLVGVVKEQKRLKDWINRAYQEIQLHRQDWDWLRKTATFNTVADQQVYHVGSGLDIDVSDFGYWRNGSFRSYLQSAGVGTEVILEQYLDFAQFRDYYLLGSRKLVTGRPLYYTINPADKAILLGFTPDNVYVVEGEYFRAPHELSADADEPLMPPRYHMAIVYLAMVKYGMFEAAGEQIEAGRSGYSMLLHRMLADQTPIVQVGQSLI